VVVVGAGVVDVRVCVVGAGVLVVGAVRVCVPLLGVGPPTGFFGRVVTAETNSVVAVTGVDALVPVVVVPAAAAAVSSAFSWS
jgi:hypothetical protein